MRTHDVEKTSSGRVAHLDRVPASGTTTQSGARRTERTETVHELIIEGGRVRSRRSERIRRATRKALERAAKAGGLETRADLRRVLTEVRR